MRNNNNNNSPITHINPTLYLRPCGIRSGGHHLLGQPHPRSIVTRICQRLQPLHGIHQRQRVKIAVALCAALVANGLAELERNQGRGHGQADVFEQPWQSLCVWERKKIDVRLLLSLSSTLVSLLFLFYAILIQYKYTLLHCTTPPRFTHDDQCTCCKGRVEILQIEKQSTGTGPWRCAVLNFHARVWIDDAAILHGRCVFVLELAELQHCAGWERIWIFSKDSLIAIRERERERWEIVRERLERERD